MNFKSPQIDYFCKEIIRTMKSAYQKEELTEVLEAVETTDLMDLVVFNDDVNTFEHVINTLIKVCKHTVEQAEQCTYLIHYKGKCPVKSGSFDFLKPMREAICDAGIDARIL
jgi:ATP-dependent Clp protease adaptor protein ClpS